VKSLEKSCANIGRFADQKASINILSFVHPALAVPPPFFDQTGHIRRDLTVESQWLPGPWMQKPDRFCMKGMPRAHPEAIVDKLLVFTEYCALYDLISTI
jgi:hypothetical protein